MHRQRLASFILLLVAIPGCSSFRRVADTPKGASVPLFDGMGSHHRAVTTSDPLAQQYFDQGLVWTFAFNHDEAIRSYRQAARLDPHCAMAYWGIAVCNGPHINNPLMPPVRSQAAWDALQQAISRKPKASLVERDLIDALSKRYAASPPVDRKPLDEAYAVAMREVWKKYPNDPDVGTLFVEAMMDLRPWDLWTKDGKPQTGTQEILAALEAVLHLQPDHPGALHLYIHAVEASPNPEYATAAGDRLRRLVPGSGHLVHMPTHIDVLTGRWKDASDFNMKAIEVDRKYRKVSPKQDFYRIYMAHNHHMLSFAAMMEGRGDVAVRAAREMVSGVPEDYARRESTLIDGYMGAPYEALMRFGRWDEILKEPAPPSYFPITTAIWRFTRGIAFAAKGQLADAENERELFKDAAAAVPTDAMMAINPAERILAIAEHVLDGEIAYRRGRTDEAVAALRQAVTVEDNLRYTEPPEWILPVRHTLGAFLMEAGRYEEAETVYREDLDEWPENGWSLYGLAQCLRARGAGPEAADAERKFKKAWSRADTRISSSCLCVSGKRG